MDINFIKDLQEKKECILPFEQLKEHPLFGRIYFNEVVDEKNNIIEKYFERVFSDLKFKKFLKENNIIFMLGINNPDIGANNIKLIIR